MKKLMTTLLAILIMASPAFAITSVDEGTAKVKFGPVKTKVDNSKENQKVTISRAGDNLIIGCAYAKTKVKGIKTSSTTIASVMIFDSIQGDLESGVTYDLSNSEVTESTFITSAAKLKNLKVKGINSVAEELNGEIPVVTGKMKVKSFNSETNEITADISLVIKPIAVQKGTKVKVSQKGQRIKMKVNTIVE